MFVLLVNSMGNTWAFLSLITSLLIRGTENVEFKIGLMGMAIVLIILIAVVNVINIYLKSNKAEEGPV